MCFHVHISHPVNVHAEVNLCGGNIGVAKHFLDASDVRTVLEHMYGEGMPQGVGCNVSVDSSFFCIALKHFPETLAAHGLAGAVGK